MFTHFKKLCSLFLYSFIYNDYCHYCNSLLLKQNTLCLSCKDILLNLSNHQKTNLFSKKIEIFYCYNWNSLTHDYLYPLIEKIKNVQSVKEAQHLIPNFFPYFEKINNPIKGINNPKLWVPVPCLKNPSRTLYLAKALQSFWGGEVICLIDFKNYLEIEQKRKKRADRKVRDFKLLVNHKELNDLVENYNIILVDDIVTTGFTMESCLLTLNLNRAYGWCFAHRNKKLE